MKRMVHGLVEALGIDLDDAMEWMERKRHVRVACAISMVCGLPFAVANMLEPARRLLGMIELACVLFFFLPAWVMVGLPPNALAAERLLVVGALCISSALVVLGSVEGTGLFWVYSVPFLAFFVAGQRRGWYYSLAMLVVHALCLLVLGPHLPWSYPYAPDVRGRFLMAMVYYLLIAATFNQARSRFETALQQRKSEAEAASLAKSQFLASASHDLRQPAHALGLFVARLQQLPQDAQAREVVAGVEAVAHTLQDMLDAFLDYSRLDSQLAQARSRSFALNAVFDSLRISFADTARLKGLRLRVRSTAVWVHTDAVLLHRVLLNLLGNAVQHTPHGTVLLTCRPGRQPGAVRIQVRDSGIGIAPEHQRRVFEEFFQVESAERDRHQGLGLGLSIVERACSLLGLRMELRSALGCGTTFTLHVPRGKMGANDLVPPTVEQGVLADLQGMRVLLLAGDDLGRRALASLLQSWGCAVSVASSYEQALTVWAAAPWPDFIITDYRLAGSRNGVEAVQGLRTRAQVQMAGCVLSDDADEGVQEAVVRASLALLQKPLRPAPLRSVLRQYWNSRQVRASDALAPHAYGS